MPRRRCLRELAYNAVSNYSHQELAASQQLLEKRKVEPDHATALPVFTKKTKTNSKSVSTQKRSKQTRPVTTARPSPQSTLLPDLNSAIPDTNIDYNSIWDLVRINKMGPKKQKEGDPMSYYVPSGGAKGSTGYKEILEKLSLKFDGNDPLRRKITPWQHLSLQRLEDFKCPYVTNLEDKQLASVVARRIKQTVQELALTEADLRQVVCQDLFHDPTTVPLEPTDNYDNYDYIVVRVLEHIGPFGDHDDAAIRSGDVQWQFVLWSQAERAAGKGGKLDDIADPRARTQYLVPSPKDLRSRADLSFSIRTSESTHVALPKDFPGWFHDTYQSCALFTHAEFKKTGTPQDFKTALHQWALTAFITLSDRLRVVRNEDWFTLAEDGVPNTLRHFGYLVCGSSVELWEMRVRKVQDPKNQRDSFLHIGHIEFPTRRLLGFVLTEDKDVQAFAEWHKAIVQWAVQVYCREDMDDVNALLDGAMDGNDWVKSWKDVMQEVNEDLEVQDIRSGTDNEHSPDRSGILISCGNSYVQKKQPQIDTPDSERTETTRDTNASQSKKRKSPDEPNPSSRKRRGPRARRGPRRRRGRTVTKEGKGSRQKLSVTSSVTSSAAAHRPKRRE